MANRNWASGGKIYTMHVKPVLLDCNFVVDSANSNGLGIRNLKGPAIANVFMRTSAAPSAGNPNPAAGVIVVRLMDKFSRSFSGFNAVISPVSGSALKVDNSVLSQSSPYVITTLGNLTVAQWNALGVPVGVTPAPGVSFIASSIGAGANSSTSRVMTPAAAGSAVASIETVGDPNLSINPNSSANQGFGAQFILQCRGYSGAIISPTNESIISLAFYLSDSSIVVQGE